MFGNESGMKDMILKKILELFENLPDEGEVEKKPEVEVSIEADPLEKKELL